MRSPVNLSIGARSHPAGGQSNRPGLRLLRRPVPLAPALRPRPVTRAAGALGPWPVTNRRQPPGAPSAGKRGLFGKIRRGALAQFLTQPFNLSQLALNALEERSLRLDPFIDQKSRGLGPSFEDAGRDQRIHRVR